MIQPVSQLRDTVTVSRRAMLRDTGWGLLGLSLAQWILADGVRCAAAADDAVLESLNRFPRMVQEYFVARIRRAEGASLGVKQGLMTKGDAEQYVRTVRKKIRESFGPFPERTPLKPQITGVVDRDTYKIEKVIFESRPGFLVTANLYVPKGREFPLPGVVGTCGHSGNGKCAEAYQPFAQGLARMG
ncbi:MAG: hypothetical protein ACYSWU_08780, partial [Planctomycetota bacterium]